MSKEIKKFLFNHGTDLLVAIISIILLIIGIKIMGPVSIIIILILDITWFIVPIVKKKGEKKSEGDFMKKKNVHEMKEKKKTSEKSEKKKKKKIWIVVKIILLIMLLMFIAASIVGGIFIYKVVKNAPHFDPDNLYQNESSIFRKPNGEIFKKIGAEKREIITYDEMSESLINAIIATEDARFFQHNGFDLPRFMVASIKQVLRKGGGGASTLTMQLSKNFYTSTEAEGIEGIKRKFTDIYMAIFQIEKKYTKEQIMEFYANSNYLGGGAYGVEQASLNYFNKHASELNIAESAMIAGLFQAPYKYDPILHPEAAEKRRKTVLYLMERHGYITEEEKKAAEELTVDKLLQQSNENNLNENDQYKAFFDTVVAEIQENTGLNPYEVSMDVTTTLDPEKQDYINSIMDGTNFYWENDKVTAGISVIDNESGAIVAIGAGRNRTGIDWNTATQTKNQIGSTAKPLYDYGPGIEFENWSTYTPFIDEPYSYSDGTPITNYDGGYRGFLTMREAIMDSRNIPALKAFQQNKLSNIKKFVTSLGLHPESYLHEAHAVGAGGGESPLSMSAAYAAFARGGYYIEPYSYTSITYRNTGETVQNKKVKEKVMSEATAYMITDILISTGQSALGRYNNINGVTFAAKTGTTNFSTDDKRKLGLPDNAINDLWVVGYDPDYSVAVWYGYVRNSKEDFANYTIYGSRQHAALFQAVGRGIFKNGKKWTKPEDVVEVQIEYGSNPAALPSDGTPPGSIVTELFKKGTEPTTVSTNYIKLSDPTGLSAKLNGTKVTLTWNKVSPPEILSSGSYGTFGYNVYKDEGGQLKLLKFVTDTNYTDTISENDKSATYVVKTTYSNAEKFMSNGATLNVKFKSEITASFADNSSETKVQVGTTFVEPMIIVKEDGKEVFKGNVSSGDVKITKSIIKGGIEVNNVNTSEVSQEPYIIQYTITYKGEQLEKKLGRRVYIVEKT